MAFSCLDGGRVALATMLSPLFFVCVVTCGSDRQAEARVAAAEGVEGPSLFSPASAEATQSEEKLALIVAIAEQGEPAEGARGLPAPERSRKRRRAVEQRAATPWVSC